MKRLIAVLLFWLTAAPAFATTYFVRTGGNDALHTCNQAQTDNDANAKSTISGGISCLSSGDTLNIHAGTYAETLTTSQFNGKSGSSYSAATTIQAASADVVIIRPTSGNRGMNLGSTAGVNIQYIIFKNLILDGSASNSSTDLDGVSAGGGGNGGSITNIKFDNVEVKNFSGNGYEWSGVASSWWIRGGSVHDNATATSALGFRHCWYVESSNNLVENSQCYNMTAYGVHNYSGPWNNNVYRNLTIHNTGTYTGHGSFGIGLYSGDSNKAYNNVVYNNAGGIDIGLGATNSVAVENTVYANNGGTNQGVHLGNASGSVVMNNIIYGNNQNYVDDGASSTTVSNNLCNSVGTGCQFGGDPLFVNTSSANFRVQSGSPAINQGGAISGYIGCTPNSTCFDFDGIVRPQGTAPDIGAFEFTSGVIPQIAITSPGSDLTVTSSTITISGTSSLTSSGSVMWTCDRCTPTPGTASGLATWSTSALTLKAGINVFTATASDGSGNSSTPAARIITYAPPFPGNELEAAYGFDAGSGLTAADSSPSKPANNGTLIGPPTWITPGHTGTNSALHFNGLTQYVSVPDSNTLDVTQSLTISAWVRPTGLVKTDFRAIASKVDFANQVPIALYAAIAGGYGCTAGGWGAWVALNGSGGPYALACDSNPLAIGIWTHIAVTYDYNGSNGTTSAIRLYRNGTLVATTLANGYIEPTPDPLYLGNSQFSEFFEGDIDEFRYYDWGIPRTSANNTSPTSACNAEQYTTAPSVMGDLVCPVIPAAAPGVSKFKVAAGSTFKLGAGATFKLGQ